MVYTQCLKVAGLERKSGVRAGKCQMARSQVMPVLLSYDTLYISLRVSKMSLESLMLGGGGVLGLAPGFSNSLR